MFLFDNSPGGGPEFPDPKGPPRCANCSRTYDDPHPSCKADVHLGNAVVEPWVPTHRVRARMSIPAEHSDATEYREIEAKNRKALLEAFKSDSQPDQVMDCATCGMVPFRWKPSPEAGPYWRCSVCGKPHRIPESPHSDLWPCDECRELPKYDQNPGIDHEYACASCRHKSTGWRMTEPQARAEWNERFGRARQKIPSEAELVESLRGRAPTLSQKVRAELDHGGKSAQAAKWAETKKRIHPRCYEEDHNPPGHAPKIGCLECGGKGVHFDDCAAKNPHNLTSCTCGEIPQPVAVQYSNGWSWGMWCGNRISDGFPTVTGLVKAWNGGWHSRPCGDAARIGIPRRYDIPTSLTLGCAELPDEYRDETCNCKPEKHEGHKKGDPVCKHYVWS